MSPQAHAVLPAPAARLPGVPARLHLLVPNPVPVSQEPARQPPLPALTGLRTLLALNILFFHFMPPHAGLLAPLFSNSFVFVGFFFLLSGFVLSYNYSGRALTLNPRQFWLARFARLYPVYLLALALSVPILVAEWQGRPHAEFWQGIVLTPLLLHAWLPSVATFWNIVGWTLSCELVLYAALPAILRIWATYAAALDRPRRLIVLFLALWLLGMVPHLLYLQLNPDHLAAPVDRYSYGLWLRALKFSPPAYVCVFLAGIVLGKLHLQLTLSSGRRFILAATSLALIVTLLTTAAPRIPYLLLHGALLLPLFAILTLGLSGPNPVASFFSWTPLLAIGETTFCLYMLHFNTMNLLQAARVWERLHLAPLDPWISYAFVLTLAAAAHHLVEKPARRAILHRFSPQP